MDKEYFRQRRENRRKKFKDLLGGKCIICGSKKNLQFDHKDPKKKEFRISLMIDSPEQRLLNELKKCQLLCAKCHHKKTLDKQEFGIESSIYKVLGKSDLVEKLNGYLWFALSLI